MKYFVYLSDAKLDMLYPQLGLSFPDHKRESFFGFDLKILKGQIKESRGLEATKYQQLEAITRKLETSDFVGGLDDDKPFIRGTLKLAWNSFGEMSPEESPLTFWGGSVGNTLFGLAGSKYHLTGREGGNRVGAASLTPDIVHWLCKRLDVPMVSFENPKELIPDLRFGLGGDVLTEYDIANAVYLAAFERPNQTASKTRFEFLAKVLHRSEWPSGFRMGKTINKIILASPVFVALTE